MDTRKGCPPYCWVRGGMEQYGGRGATRCTGGTPLRGGWGQPASKHNIAPPGDSRKPQKINISISVFPLRVRAENF